MEDFSRCNDDHLIIIKGHRTKRPRPPSSPVSGQGSGLIPSSTTTMTSDDDDDDHSYETTESTIEDEIMANCLMYLAHSGGGCVRHDEEVKLLANKIVSSDHSTEMKGGGLFVYSCKTCNKNFPSFQALGGHRASHKRPKNMLVLEDKKPIFTASTQNLDDDDDDEEQGGKFKRLSEDDNNISPEFMTNKVSHQKVTVGKHKSKIHECSFCGSEFSSGQALGGHMRRHRNSSNAAAAKVNNIGVETEKPAIRVFQLDLNLPAPEDDHHHHGHHHHQRDMIMKLQFNKEASAASALVDCHY